MQAFHSDPQLREVILGGIEWHRQHDRLASVTFASTGHVCDIGCQVATLRMWDPARYAHRALATALGLPMWLMCLQGDICEALAMEEQRAWPSRLIGAIPLGADIDGVKWSFMAAMLARMVASGLNPGGVVGRVVVLCRRAAAGDMPAHVEWQAARESVETSAETSARIKTTVAARNAAEMVAEMRSWAAAEMVAVAAIGAAREAVEAMAAETEERMAQAADLLRLLGEAR